MRNEFDVWTWINQKSLVERYLVHNIVQKHWNMFSALCIIWMHCVGQFNCVIYAYWYHQRGTFFIDNSLHECMVGGNLLPSKSNENSWENVFLFMITSIYIERLTTSLFNCLADTDFYQLIVEEESIGDWILIRIG